jgi:hypothetical protein
MKLLAEELDKLPTIWVVWEVDVEKRKFTSVSPGWIFFNKKQVEEYIKNINTRYITKHFVAIPFEASTSSYIQEVEQEETEKREKLIAANRKIKKAGPK